MLSYLDALADHELIGVAAQDARAQAAAAPEVLAGAALEAVLLAELSCRCTQFQAQGAASPVTGRQEGGRSTL